MFWLPFFLSMALAVTIEDVKFPEVLNYQGKHLHLNGAALKEVTIFSVDVYVVGLYAEKPSSDPEKLLANRDFKIVRIHFLRDIDKEDLVESWLKDLAHVCGPACHELLPLGHGLSRKLDHVKEGQEFLYELHETKIRLLTRNQEVGTIEHPAMPGAVLKALFKGADIRIPLLRGPLTKTSKPVSE